MKRAITLFLCLLFLFAGGFLSSSCKSRKDQCEANYQVKHKKLKKNRSNYGTKYGMKSKAPRKTYVIRNK